MRRRRVIRALAGGTAVATAGCLGGPPSPLGPISERPLTVDGEWRQTDGGPGNARAADGSGPGESYEVRWRYTAREGGSFDPLAVVDGTVFAASGRSLVGLSTRDGTEEWRASIDVDAADPAASETKPMAVGPDRVYLPVGHLRLDAADATLSSYPGASGRVDGLTLANDTLVYSAGRDVIATGLDAETPLWTRRFDSEPDAIACDGDMVGITVDGNVVGVGLDGGDRRWRYDVLDRSYHLNLVGRSGRFYVVPSTGHVLTSVDAATGEERWQYDVGYHANVAATDDRIVLGATPRQERKRRFVVLGRDGRRHWATPEETNDTTYFAPIVADGVVYGGHVADTFAYALDGGERLWSLSENDRSLLGGGLSRVSKFVVAGSALFLEQAGDVYGLGPA